MHAQCVSLTPCSNVNDRDLCEEYISWLLIVSRF